MRFKNELERNITIKLGYANAKIYKAAPLPPVADTEEMEEGKEGGEITEAGGGGASSTR